jgi:hypothetical protein
MMTPACDCGAATRANGNWWGPHRDKVHEVGIGWEEFLKRLDLSYWPETERTMLRGQDGWAFNVAMRFQSVALDLEKANRPYYWSSYYLLSRIIEKTRQDMTVLEAVEAVAITFLSRNLTDDDVVRQLKQMEIWP